MPHELKLIPQTIVDGWQACCSCGWKSFLSFYEIEDRDALIAKLEEQHRLHVETSDR